MKRGLFLLKGGSYKSHEHKKPSCNPVSNYDCGSQSAHTKHLPIPGGGIAEEARALTAEEIAERGYPQIPTVVYYDDGTASRPPGYGNGKAGFTHLPIMSYDGDSLVVGSPTKYAYGLNSSGSILGYQVVIKGDCREDTAIPFSAIFVRRKKQAV